MNLTNCFLIFLFWNLCSLAQADVKDPIYDELEGTALVEALIRDGKLTKASSEIKNLPTSGTYWIVSGNLFFAQEKYKQAEQAYSKASPTADRELRRARVQYKLKSFESCQKFFKTSQDLWLNSESDIIAKTACEFNLQNFDAAWSSLLKGQKKFNSFAILREQVALLIELSLVNEALKTALLDQNLRSASQLLALAEMFLNKKAGNEAQVLVELARVRFPFDVDVNLSFAQIYFQKGQLLSTVDAFERAAKTDAKYNYHAAELRRQMGHHEQAQYFNQLIPDSIERLKSRLALYVDSNSYPLIASMESVLSRSELKDDDEIRYALAYSLIRQGDTDRSLLHLNRIHRPELLEKTALLKKAILECRTSSGACRL